MARMLPATLAVALVAAVAVAGCKKNDNANTSADTTPAATTPEATPPASNPPAGPMDTTTPPATSPILTGLDLGNAVGTDNRVTTPGTSFAKGDTIHASVATNGDQAATLTARWTYQDGQVVHNEDKSVPAGAHKVEVLIDGNLVQSKDFSVH